MQQTLLLIFCGELKLQMNLSLWTGHSVSRLLLANDVKTERNKEKAYVGQPGEEDWVSNKGKNWLLMRCDRKYPIADDAQLLSNTLMYQKKDEQLSQNGMCTLTSTFFYSSPFFIPPWYSLQIEN